MPFLSSLFPKKSEPVNSYAEFWNWFQKNEKTFYSVVKQKGDVVNHFFSKLSPKLKELKEGYYYLTGMLNDNTVELVFTADGITKNIVFVEELVSAAPTIDGWKFTALKPSLNIEDVTIRMDKFDFSRENIFFYSNDHHNFPDEIDIKVIHTDYSEKDKQVISNGTYIFLDNFLGELNFATTIDNLEIIGKDSAKKELVPIGKLKDFLIWRQKEFIEKYEGVRRNTQNDKHAVLEAEFEDGNKLIATINTELLEWDSKSSHPWIVVAEIKYNGTKNNGLPDNATYNMLNDIEKELMLELKDSDGYLNIGRQSVKGVREIYFACRDFRKPSKVLYDAELKYAKKLEISYDIYKDKYWQSFNRFRKRE